MGAGTGLPGILAAKCRARVILSDHCILPKSLAHLRNCCLANNLVPGSDIKVIGLSWGLLLSSLYKLPAIDLIISADCFYDPRVFEDILVTVSFLIEKNPSAKFIFTYQERSSDWCFEVLLKKWDLRAARINIDDIGEYSGVNLIEIMGKHTIHLIEIYRWFGLEESQVFFLILTAKFFKLGGFLNFELAKIMFVSRSSACFLNSLRKKIIFIY